jgi:hypothetical protein
MSESRAKSLRDINMLIAKHIMGWASALGKNRPFSLTKVIHFGPEQIEYTGWLPERQNENSGLFDALRFQSGKGEA